MALTETRSDTDATSAGDRARRAPSAVEQLIGSGDHTSIGRLFIGFGFALASLSLTLWALTGVDALTDNGFLGSRPAQLAASAQVALLFLGIVPLLLGVAIAVVPLQLGSPSIAFPRAATLSFWTWLLSSGIFAVSIALDGGVLGGDETAAKLGNVSLGAVLVALSLGAVCVATTVMAHRPLGMRLAWVPGLSWASLVSAALLLVTLGSAIAHTVLGQVGRMGPAALATNFTDGLGWLLRGPAVFVFAIPVLGIAIDVVATASGRRFAQTDVLQLIVGLYAILAFGAWAQLPSALNTALWTLFAFGITVPILGLLGAIGDSLRQGKPVVSPALILSIVSVLLLMGAAVTGWVQSLSLAGQGTLFGASPATLASAQTAFVAGAALLRQPALVAAAVGRARQLGRGAAHRPAARSRRRPPRHHPAGAVGGPARRRDDRLPDLRPPRRRRGRPAGPRRSERPGGRHAGHRGPGRRAGAGSHPRVVVPEPRRRRHRPARAGPGDIAVPVARRP